MGDYSEKLTQIIKSNDIKSVSIVRMEVPCCGGMENTVREALRKCGRDIPCEVTVIGRDGRILKSEKMQTGPAPLLGRLPQF